MSFVGSICACLQNLFKGESILLRIHFSIRALYTASAQKVEGLSSTACAAIGRDDPPWG